MDPLSLALLGGGAFFVAKALGNLSKKPGSAAGAVVNGKVVPKPGSNVPTTTNYTLPTVSTDRSAENVMLALAQGAKTVASSIQAVPGIGAAATAVFLSGQLGGKITGDWMGSLAGGATGLAGNAGNLGRLVGAEIDKLFGGDGKGATGTTAQITGFIYFLIVGGALLAPFGSTVGAAFLWSFPVLAGIAYGVTSFISDRVKLDYGQAGVLRDTTAAGLEVLNNAVKAANQTLLKTGQFSNADIYTVDAQNRNRANATAFTIGYMTQQNKLRKQVWMKRPRGLFMNDENHRKFAEERGLFLSDTNLNVLINALIAPLGGGLYNSVITAAQQVAAKNSGRFVANGIAWQQCLQENWGTMVTTWKQHLDYYRNEGVFDCDAIYENGPTIDNDASTAAGAVVMTQPTKRRLLGFLGAEFTVWVDSKGNELNASGDTKFGSTIMAADATKKTGKLTCYSA